MSTILQTCMRCRTLCRPTLLQSQQQRNFAVYKAREITIAVTLQQDLDNLGYTGQVVQVARGYARNYLVPRGLAQYTFVKTRAAMNHRKQSNARTDAAQPAETANTAVTAEVEQRRFNEQLRAKLAKTVICCNKRPANDTPARNDSSDRAGEPFSGQPINSLYVYSKILKIHPDISTQLYSDRITLPSGGIATFGQHTARIQLYPAVQNQPIDIQIQVKPSATVS